MRGRHGTSISVDKIIERALDRAEYELEQYCLGLGIRKLALAAAYAHAAAERFGSGVYPGGEGVSDQVSAMSLRAAQGVQLLPEVGAGELALGDGRARKGKTLDASPEIQGDRGEKVKKRKSAISKYWAKFTPEERQQEMRRRQKKSARRGGKMVGFGTTPRDFKKPPKPAKRELTTKSQKAVDAALEEVKRRKARAAELKRESRARVKAAKEKAVQAKTRARSSTRYKPTREEERARQNVYIGRNHLRNEGKTEEEINAQLPLPPKGPLSPEYIQAAEALKAQAGE